LNQRFTLLLLVIIAFTGCKKASLIGTDLLPNSDNLNGTFTDTATVVSYTVLEDSLKTSNLSKYLVGSVDDPTFGKSTASIFTQLRLPSNNINLGLKDTLFIDSVVLQLAFEGFAGDTTVQQTFNVYELTEAMNADSDYYSNKSFAINPVAIGTKTFTFPAFYDSVHVLSQYVAPHLRIPLSNSFGQTILDQSGGANFADNNAFITFFKGICIAPDVSASYSKAIYYFNLDKTISRVNCYYHTPNDTSKVFSLLINSDCARIDYYTHNYTGYPIESYLNSPNKVQGSDQIFASGMAGVKTKLELPYAAFLENKIINKAELVLTKIIDPTGIDTTTFKNPPQLVLLTADSNGHNATIPDVSSYALLQYGGMATSYINYSGQKVIQYKFSIATQLQEVVSHLKDDYGLYLLTYPSPESGRRIVIGGNNRNDDFKLKLNLIYTNLN